MKLMAIFRGTRLLEYRIGIDASRSLEFKENVSTQTLIPLEELEAVMFEDEEMGAYVNTDVFMPKKSWEINKTKMSLIDLESVPATKIRKVKWMDCGVDELSTFFSPEEIHLIEENKAYYESLGVEKYAPGYQITWPHKVPTRNVEVVTTDLVRITTKEIEGIILTDIIPEESAE